jgi:arylesterase / paraoxonase
MKTFKKIIVMVVIVIVLLAIRTMWYAGIFKPLTPVDPQKHTLITGMVGAEDITIDQSTGLALVSSTDRRKVLQGDAVKGAIYQLDFMADKPVFKDLTASFDQDDFRPHGISLYTDDSDSSKWLFVVNHRISGHSIEIFQYTDTALVHKETVKSTLLKKPNDVTGVGKRAFFCTNDHDSDGGGFSSFEDFLLIGTGSVVYYDGNDMKMLDDGIRYANGITASKDGKKLYVAACTDGSINVYDREPFKKTGNIQCKTGVDNLEWDADGNLWVGAHPKLLKFLSHAKDSQKRSPSQALKINLQNLEKPEITEMYVNDGNPLSGSSVTAVYKNILLLGGVFDDGVLKIEKKQ